MVLKNIFLFYRKSYILNDISKYRNLIIKCTFHSEVKKVKKTKKVKKEEWPQSPNINIIHELRYPESWAEAIDSWDFRGEKPGSGLEQALFWKEKTTKQKEEFERQIQLPPRKKHPLLLDEYFIESYKDKLHKEFYWKSHIKNVKKCYFGLWIEELECYEKDDYRQMCYDQSPFLYSVCCRKNIHNRPLYYSIFMEPSTINKKDLKEKTFKQIAPLKFYDREESSNLKEKFKPKQGVCFFGSETICDVDDKSKVLICRMCGKLPNPEELAEFNNYVEIEERNLALERLEQKRWREFYRKSDILYKLKWKRRKRVDRIRKVKKKRWKKKDI